VLQGGCEEEGLVFEEVEGITNSPYEDGGDDDDDDDDDVDDSDGDDILIQENCSLSTWPIYLICTNI
jgi:hypothetical protein